MNEAQKPFFLGLYTSQYTFNINIIAYFPSNVKFFTKMFLEYYRKKLKLFPVCLQIQKKDCTIIVRTVEKLFKDHRPFHQEYCRICHRARRYPFLFGSKVSPRPK